MIRTLKQILTIIALLFFAACNTLEFEAPVKNSVVSAYINQDYWEADSLTEAYYYENYLFIAATGDNENIILKIQNPLIGDNQNVEIEYINKVTNETVNAKSDNLVVSLSVLDTINAGPSLVSGTFTGDFSLNSGEIIKIKGGKINNAATNSLFCENSIRAHLSSNTDIGGKWELVKIINRETSEIQNPTCNDKIYLSFFNENYLPEKINDCDCNFIIEGSNNSLWGDYNINDSNNIEFLNQETTNNEGTKYNKFLESLVFKSVTSSSSYFINNSLMHLESNGYIVVLYRK
jgi:hypothetical protein